MIKNHYYNEENVFIITFDINYKSTTVIDISAQ